MMNLQVSPFAITLTEPENETIWKNVPENIAKSEDMHKKKKCEEIVMVQFTSKKNVKKNVKNCEKWWKTAEKFVKLKNYEK